MEEKNKVPFLIESANGHDTKEVEPAQVEAEVEKHLKDDKWVTVEKTDGETKILTEKPEEKPKGDEESELAPGKLISSEEVKKKEEKTGDWKDTFGDNGSKIKSATVTNKMKGG